MSARRIVSIYLPQFAMERWTRSRQQQGNAPSDDIPTALVREGPHGPMIHATNRAARVLGVTQGARMVDMRALCPHLQIDYADVAGDRAALDRLVLWMRRWCPWTVRDGDQGVILDTTGSDHLLGGERAMLIEMETQLSYLGVSAQLAIAPSWGGAWALARFGSVRAICPDGQLLQQLAPLPVAALRLEPETVLLLQRLGLKTIGALRDVPRLSLKRRFVKAPLAANPLMRLDQALGQLAEPVGSVEAQPRPRVQSRLAEPIFDPSPYLPQLCETLCQHLIDQGRGCRSLQLTVYRTDGEVSDIRVVTSVPTRDPQHLQSLFRDKIDRLAPGFGFDLITLEAGGLEPMALQQTRLDGVQSEDLPIAQLIDRLSAKFGPRTVSRPTVVQSHIPERAEIRVPALAADVPPPAPVLAERPLRLFEPPEEIRVLYAVPEGPPAQFVWRRQTLRVVRSAGPERIAPEWWKDRSGTRLRDYFKIEDQAGRRLWLYREGLLGDGRGAEPRWFVHGAFA